MTKQNLNSTMSRISWIDYAKGLGIFSVAALHVLKGIITAGIMTDPNALFIRDAWSYYSFNMPIFFFLGGFFIYRSINRPLTQFMLNRLRTLVYPYVVWSLITLLVGTLAINYTNSGLAINSENLGRLFYNPILHYWFLYAIFFVVTGWIILAKLRLSPYVFLIISIGMFIFIQFNTEPILYWVWGFMQFAIYFAVGAIISKPFRDWMENSSTSRLVLISVIGLGIWLFFVSQGIDFALAGLQPLVSAIGMLGVLTTCKLLANFNLARFMEMWGHVSLEIYLVHVMAGALFRTALFHIFNINNFAVHFIGGVLFAVYVPIAIAHVAKQLNINFLFTLSKPKKAPDRASAISSSQVPSINKHI